MMTWLAIATLGAGVGFALGWMLRAQYAPELLVVDLVGRKTVEPDKFAAAVMLDKGLRTTDGRLLMRGVRVGLDFTTGEVSVVTAGGMPIAKGHPVRSRLKDFDGLNLALDGLYYEVGL